MSKFDNFRHKVFGHIWKKENMIRVKGINTVSTATFLQVRTCKVCGKRQWRFAILPFNNPWTEMSNCSVDTLIEKRAIIPFSALNLEEHGQFIETAQEWFKLVR